MTEGVHGVRRQQEPPALWRNHDYVLLLTGQTASKIGSGMSMFAFPLVTLSLTHSLLLAGACGSLYVTGSAAASLPAGWHVDRYDRKRIMVAAMLCGGLLFASLVVADWLGHLGTAQLLLAATLAGVVAAYYSPAELAAVHKIVTTTQLPSAMAANQARQMVSNLVAGPAGGLLLAAGRTLPFAVDAASYLVAVITTTRVRSFLGPEPAGEAQATWSAVRAGLEWLWRRRELRLIVLAATALNFAAAGLLLAVTLILRREGVGYAQIGLLESAAATAGFAGAAGAGWLIARLPTGQLAIGATGVVAVALFGMSLTTSYAGYMALLVVAFLAIPVINSALVGYQVAITPEHLQGRVSSSFGFLASCSQPLGPLLAGVLLQTLPSPVTLTSFAAVVFGAVAAMAGAASIRSIPRPAEWPVPQLGSSSTVGAASDPDTHTGRR